MDTILINRIKQGLRIQHGLLDDDLQADVEACLADLKLAGVIHADMEADPLIFNAIKLWCRSLFTDDPVKAAEYMKRYENLKACMMMADGYGRPAEVEEPSDE